MARSSDPDEIEYQHIELFDSGLRSSFRIHNHSFRSLSFSSSKDAVDDEVVRQWDEIQRLPTYQRSRAFLFDEYDDQTKDFKGKRVVDAAQLGAPDRHLFIERLIKKIEADNRRLLLKLRRRTDKVGIKLPSVELRYHNLSVEAECKVVDGKPLPTLWNSLKDIPLSVISKLPGARSQVAKIGIVKNVSGMIKPGRLTLLLGPPGCGKTSLLSALSGNSSKSLKVSGDITYNGYNLREFVPQKSSVYVSQYDVHMPEMTVRETVDFSARCQGVGSRTDIMVELSRREKEAGVMPDQEVDAYMKAISTAGLRSTLQTDYILKILGLDICADTMVGDVMIRGISGGQKKRLTTGEMIVGPTKALLMDEITNGLDSSTAYQIVACIQQFVHLTDATALVALLQPAPETFELFDDLILMAEGKIVYHGPRSSALDFFEDCGFRCPQRKGIADFLQEVISRKDQMQYWFPDDQSYKYVSVDMFHERFIASPAGKELFTEVSQSYHRSQSDEKSISFDIFSLSNWELFKACMSREFLLMKRNAFLYIFKNVQLVIIGSIAMTLFLRTRMEVDVLHANYYLGALFFGLIFLIVDGFPEAALTVIRLPVFFKQRDLYFYPAWAYAIPATILKIPLSVVESLVWTSLTYYVIGYSPEVGRFFRHFLLLCVVHFSSLSLFRFIASFFQTMVASSAASSFLLLFLFIFGGFVIPHPSMPDWLKWGFWVSPLSYGEIGISVNEFLAPRWQKPSISSDITLGQEILESRGLDFAGNYYWISVAALIGFGLIANIGFILSLTFLKAPGTSAAIISRKKLSQLRGAQNLAEVSQGYGKSDRPFPATRLEPPGGKMVLPFQPLSVVFRNINYYIDTPVEMKEHGFTEKRCQLLKDITGAFMPGVLTALMGVSGAGKTTLLDVLSGRKTSGFIEGDIRIGGFPKVQDTFARVSGYCEQADIHSPQITVEESVVFSAWLRLSDKIDTKTRAEFVNEVLETIELLEIKDSLVGMPGENGLSTEQRKRLTLAVELVANPSIVFMDEPTTGLDARAAAIVMRAVKNVAETGRTVVCTIHQPSIDIFEAFDELLLLKTGGQVIYSGPLGQHSAKLIEYLEQIPGVAKISDGHNPAAWMLDVTSASKEAELEVDFAQAYQKSHLNQKTEDLVKQLSSPPPDSKDLQFPTRYARNGWEQFRSCLWKQHWSYWRSPSYNLLRLVHTFISSLIFGLLFWQQGKKLENQQSVFTVFGSMFTGVLFLGINHCANILPHVSAERTVVYRERFAGMYTSWAYSCAQVVIELPYLFVESLMFTVITYPMIGYFSSAYKVFWYFYTMFCTLAYFNYLGMMMVSLTPNFQVAAIISSAFYSLFNLFAGFLAPQSFIPKWWIWLFYLSPTSWSLNGMLTSQYGDVEKEIEIFGKTETVAAFLRDYFGYQHDQLWVVAIVLIAFPLAFATLFAIFMEKLNFQRR